MYSFNLILLLSIAFASSCTDPYLHKRDDGGQYPLFAGSPFPYIRGNIPNRDEKIIIKGTVFRTTMCQLQPVRGFCFFNLVRFYYDVNSRDCKQFIYKGCGGNVNRFRTYQECVKTCKA